MLTADQARVPGPEDGCQREHGIAQAWPQRSRDGDGEDERWKRQKHVGQAHQELVDETSKESGNRTDNHAHDDRNGQYDHRDHQ